MSATAPAPWITSQARQLLGQRGHAWLLAGPSGLGQYSLAMALARAWLCEQRSVDGACGTCGSCHAIEVRTHADLCVLMPETSMLELAWPLAERAQSEIDEKKRKASKEIRIEAMRDAVEFSQRTSARGRGKAVLIFPAERMNAITANALLKTLEEPPGDVRFVLASGASHLLLPTIRSRCLGHRMVWPEHEAAIAWVGLQGLAGDDATVLLRAAGGRPDDAVALARSGRTARSWRQFPAAMARGEVAWVKDWSAAQIIDALQKLCHDMAAALTGATPRFFETADLPARGSVAALTAWSNALGKIMRTVEHPFNPGLMQEALVSQAQSALNSQPQPSFSV